MAATNPAMARARRALTAAALAALGLAPSRAMAQPWPEITLVTMGPGEDVFSRFGHAAMCVRDERDPRGRCYNYGTADFRTPAPLTWAVLRGTGRFWVSVVPRDNMLIAYADIEDRTIWQQHIDLPVAERRALAERLAWDALPEHRSYVYHHFRENCTTRLRDHLDRAYRGALRRGSERPYRGAGGVTWRAQVETGFGGDASLLFASEILLGRELDRGMTEWDAMFLPRVLRESARDRLGLAAEVESLRTRPLPRPGPGTRGLWGEIAVVSVAMAALGAGLRRPLHRRVHRALVGLVLGTSGLLVWTMALLSGLPELRRNELVLALWPTDLWLTAAGDERARRYAVLRLAALALTALLRGAGMLRQPLLFPCVVAAVLMGAVALSARASSRAG